VEWNAFCCTQILLPIYFASLVTRCQYTFGSNIPCLLWIYLEYRIPFLDKMNTQRPGGPTRMSALTGTSDSSFPDRYLLAGQPYRMELQSKIQVLKQEFQEIDDKNMKVSPLSLFLRMSRFIRCRLANNA
jgi:hypothetical protein